MVALSFHLINLIYPLLNMDAYAKVNIGSAGIINNQIVCGEFCAHPESAQDHGAASVTPTVVIKVMSTFVGLLCLWHKCYFGYYLSKWAHSQVCGTKQPLLSISLSQHHPRSHTVSLAS